MNFDLSPFLNFVFASREKCPSGSKGVIPTGLQTAGFTEVTLASRASPQGTACKPGGLSLSATFHQNPQTRLATGVCTRSFALIELIGRNRSEISGRMAGK